MALGIFESAHKPNCAFDRLVHYDVYYSVVHVLVKFLEFMASEDFYVIE